MREWDFIQLYIAIFIHFVLYIEKFIHVQLYKFFFIQFGLYILSLYTESGNRGV